MAFSRGFLFEATFAKIIEAGLLRWQCSRDGTQTHILRVSRGRYQGMNGPSFDAALVRVCPNCDIHKPSNGHLGDADK
jgi:hypothetical protein